MACCVQEVCRSDLKQSSPLYVAYRIQHQLAQGHEFNSAVISKMTTYIYLKKRQDGASVQRRGWRGCTSSHWPVIMIIYR